jgi:hypothetical protein
MSNVPVWEKYLMWAMLVAGFVINIIIIAVSANAKSSLDNLLKTDCPDLAGELLTNTDSRRKLQGATSDEMKDEEMNIIDNPGTVCGVLEFAAISYGTVLSIILGSQIAILVIILFSAVYWTFVYRKLMKSQGYMVEGIDVNRVAQLLAIVAMAIGYLLQFVTFGMIAVVETSSKFTNLKWIYESGNYFYDYNADDEKSVTTTTQTQEYIKSVKGIDSDMSTLYALILTLVILKTLQLVLGHGWAVSITKQD